MRSDTQTVNGLTAYVLGTSQTASSRYYEDIEEWLLNGYWGIRVWKRSSGGVETEITAGTPVAQVSRSAVGSGLQSGTWNCPETSLSSTDAIVVRVYFQYGTSGWVLAAEFITGQLGASKLDSATWTVYYYTYITKSGALYRYRFYWGTTTYNSRITNFVWTEGAIKNWNTITSWSLDILTRQWIAIYSWDFYLQTRKWNVSSLWNFDLLTKAWYPVSSTIFYIATMAWKNIETWTFQIASFGWHTIAKWIINLITPWQIPPFQPPTPGPPESPIPLLLIIPVAVAVALIVFSKR